MKGQISFSGEVIKVLEQQMKKKGMTRAELSRRLNVKTSSTSRMLESGTFPVEKLKKLSEIFGYNFFTMLSDLLDLPEPAKLSKPEEGLSACNERIRELEIENRIMLKILKSVK